MQITPPQSPAHLAAWEVARAHGISPDRWEVLQDGNTLVLRLTDSLVVRVLQDLSGPRADEAWFARETAIAAHLTAAGAPVIPLHAALPPGPHTLHGHPLNCWEYVRKVEQTAQPDELARSLFACHEAMLSYGGPLPHLAILHEAGTILQERRLFDDGVQAMLARLLDESIRLLEKPPAQPLHGDAHLGNALHTTRGLLWTDWEDAFLGPVEWDLASLIWNARVLEKDHAFADAVLQSYHSAGGACDDEVLETCMTARAVVMTAWYPILYPNPDPERQQKLRSRLEWLAVRAS